MGIIYRSISHGMQLDKTTGFKSTGNQHEVSPCCDQMGQRNIEFGHTPCIVWVQNLQLFYLLLHVLFTRSLETLELWLGTLLLYQQYQCFEEILTEILTRMIIWTFCWTNFGIAATKISEPFCSSSLPINPITGMFLSTGKPTAACRASFSKGFAIITCI